MTKIERQKFDSIIQSLKENQDFNRVKKIRQVVGVNSHYNEEDEIESIHHHYSMVLEHRKKRKGRSFISSNNGWFVYLFRKNNRYKKKEDFCITIYNSFVDYEDD